MENEFLLIPHHVAINVSDIDAAVEWYCDKLDFTVEKRDFIKGFRGKNALLKHGEFRIEIFQNERVIPRPVEDIPPPGTEVLGFRQLAFSVSDPQKFTEILESREVEITMKRPDGTVLFIRDNSGNVIEFTSQVTG
ncbi:MAG: VOC family protein [Dehalococcoidales bacterium]|nr:VOC family protein [Dehalococcoidales bacterium]